MKIRPALLLEAALALAVLASLGWTVRHFLASGYLPQPFVFDTSDTFMDWFNTAWWANQRGIHDVWRSIYPPLSFVFLDLFSLPGCHLSSPFHARDCDWLGRVAMVAAYAIDVALAWRCFRATDHATAPMRTVALALGLPMLFTLERGNLIMVALAPFMLAHGPLRIGRTARAVATAVTINFKPYLLVPVLALAIRRRWRALELAGLATLALYGATLAWVGSGTPAELAANTAHWVVFQGGQVWNEINYSTSYTPFLMLRQSGLPVLDFLPSRLVEGIETAIPLAIRATQGLALFALLAAWLQPQAVPPARLAALLLGTFLVSQSPGGYTQLFLVFLVLLEPSHRAGPVLAVVCAYLLCLVGDIPLATVLQVTSDSWLAGRSVEATFGLTWGHLLRPGLVMLIVWALAADSIALAIRAHRHHRPWPGLAPRMVAA